MVFLIFALIIFYVLCGEMACLLAKSSHHFPDGDIRRLASEIEGFPRWSFWLVGGALALYACVVYVVKR